MRDEVARLAATKAIEIARSAVKQRGATGPKGDRGNDGKDGEPGPQGKPGKDGRDGYDGKDGLPGQNGRNGFDGKNGMPGKDGRDGLNGKDGAKGPKGDKGERGDIGPMGKPGDTGPMPKHQRKGLMIRFESSPGKWGEWIVIPTGGGGGGGRDDKLTDRQKELVEIGDLIRTQGNNSSKFIKTVNGVLQWDTLDGSDLDLSSPPAIGATTPSTGVFTTLTATGQTSLGGVAGSESFRAVNVASANRYVLATAGVSGSTSTSIGTGGGAGSFNIYANGGSGVTFTTNGIGTNEQFRVSHTASAVNYVQVTGGVTGGGIATSPTIGSQGSDANVSLNLNGKGNGGVRISAQRTNFITVTGSGSGGGLATFTTEGGDTNIDLNLTPKGTGNVRFGTYTASMALTVQGYIEIKDSGGTVRKLAVIA